MQPEKQKVRLAVQGMTCTDCERHVTLALQRVGAEGITASFRRGEATFEIDPARLEEAKRAVANSGYEPGAVEILDGSPRLGGPVQSGGGDHEYDLLIIGTGGAAFSAAIQAVSYGAKVAMVERGTIGGTCVNIGCVPSKTMLRASEINHLAAHNPFPGLHTSAGSVNLQQLVGAKDELVAELRQHKYVDLIDEYGFHLIRGEARFVDPSTVEVAGRNIRARRYLIATGASPALPDIAGLADVDYLVSTTALDLTEIPRRLAVIGSGYIALELGQMFHRLGSEVTLMQRSDRLLKAYDQEVSEAVAQVLSREGIRSLTGVTYERVEQHGDVKRVHLTVNGQEQVVEAEALLVATGRKPNTAALNLEAAQVRVGSRGEVLVDEYLRTSNPNVYAAGDVTLGPQFVYVAAYEGALAAENAVGSAQRKADLTVVPAVTFTSPAIATVGMTEAKARSKGYQVLTSVLPLEAVPRALVNRDTAGLLKLVADARTRKLLGVHVVAENAGDVIYAGVLAVKFGLTIEDLRSTLAPYLTMAEGLKLATLTFDKDVSKLSCCAG
ncbi:mercury(II) reductase [Alicyclobacillus macrosporangiidus]|uniref:Mercuric reductase n=1 Tax=Alicyclobacillus macrosporangiidus TaxID=392015 RepID=A0A1I7LGI4_9BACL|nr:mercury(II) reductase [Alicyclobacillus macrosporangiidus]SFV08780.1 mercuric reductase [Alicyclobacillus macrosporangiidus]